MGSVGPLAMKCFSTSALLALAATALLATALPAQAANPTRVAAKGAAPAKHSARTDSKKSAKPAPSATSSTAATAGTTATTPSVICFQSTVRCFAAVRSPNAMHTAAIDLHPPDVRKIFPLAELQKPLPDAEDERVAQEDTTVQVSTERLGPPPSVPIGILAPFWAIRHPTQAWRIFLPVPEAK